MRCGAVRCRRQLSCRLALCSRCGGGSSPRQAPWHAESHHALLLLIFIFLIFIVLRLLGLQPPRLRRDRILDRRLQQGHPGPLLRAGVRAGTVRRLSGRAGRGGSGRGARTPHHLPSPPALRRCGKGGKTLPCVNGSGRACRAARHAGFRRKGAPAGSRAVHIAGRNDWFSGEGIRLSW